MHARVRHQTSPIDPQWLARVVDFALAAARSSTQESHAELPTPVSLPVFITDLHS